MIASSISRIAFIAGPAGMSTPPVTTPNDVVAIFVLGCHPGTGIWLFLVCGLAIDKE